MRRTVVMFLLCITGVLLNIVFNRVLIGTAFPLYLDTVMTISVTLLGGLFWGILCGALTNLIGHTIWFWGWEGYLFVFCNIATALVTFMFIRFFPRELSIAGEGSLRSMAQFATTRKSRRLGMVMDRVVIFILLSFALCIVMSVLGGILSTFIQAINPSLAGNNAISSPYGITMFSQNLPAILEEILSRFPVNIIDRLVSTFAGFGIALALRWLFKKQINFPKSNLLMN